MSLGLIELVLIPVLLAAVLGLVLVGGDRSRERRAAAVARRIGLPDAAVDAVFVRRVARRRRFVVGGVLLGLLVGPLVGSLIGGGYAGLALGSVLDQLTAPRPAPGTPRVARPASTALTDYVPGWLIGVAAAAAALAPALVVLRLTAPETARGLDEPAPTSGLLVLAALALAGLAVSLVLAGWLVRRPQPATSATGLEQADALRAQSVRDALHLTAAVSVLTGMAAAAALTEQDVDGAARAVGGWTYFLLLVAAAAVAVVHEFTGGPRHWRRRLVAV